LGINDEKEKETKKKCFNNIDLKSDNNKYIFIKVDVKNKKKGLAIGYPSQLMVVRSLPPNVLKVTPKYFKKVNKEDKFSAYINNTCLS